MNDQPVLMKNTTTGGYFVYNKRTQSRMKNLIPIFEAQVTPEMEESAGLALGHYSREKVEVVPQALPAAAPQAAPVVDQMARPDTSGWSMEQLMELTEKYDIPVHPAAKEAGYNKAIDRYFVEVNAERKADGPISGGGGTLTGNAGDGNQSEGNS
jgi:hypothetical protein